MQLMCWQTEREILSLACVVGVNGEGKGEHEKNGVLRARDEGTPATKTPIFSSPPTDFSVIQLS